MMRLFLLLALIIALPLSADAQNHATLSQFPPSLNKQEGETLLGSAVRHGGYGGLFFGVTQMHGDLVYLRGTRGAWVINMTEEYAINLGIGNYRTDTNFAPSSWSVPDISQPDLSASYRGFEMEYVNQSWRLFHFSAQALIGSGSIRYDDRDLPLDRTRSNYFVLQPGVNLNLNVTGWFRLTGGILYRHVSGVNLEGTSSSDLSGASTYMLLRFGSF